MTIIPESELVGKLVTFIRKEFIRSNVEEINAKGQYTHHAKCISFYSLQIVFKSALAQRHLLIIPSKLYEFHSDFKELLAIEKTLRKALSNQNEIAAFSINYK